MIWISRLDGDRMILNDDQILYVEATHDTLLVLSTGERLRVLESPEEIVDRVAQWRQRTMGLSLVHEFEGEADPGSRVDARRDRT